MKKYFAICLLLLSQRLSAQLATSVDAVGLRMVGGTTVTPTAGGTLTAGNYYYVVTAVDSLNGESSYIRGKLAEVNGSNNAVSITWDPSSFAVQYRVYRSVGGFGEPWVRLTTTSSSSYTDAGSAGVSATPPLVSTALGAIKGNSGIDITDQAGWTAIKSTMASGTYANYPALNFLSTFVLGTTGVYGGNGGMIRSYQGILFEAEGPYESQYSFRSQPTQFNSVVLRPQEQQIYFNDPAGYARTSIYQGVPDGADAILFNLASSNVLSNATARLMSVKNKHTELFTILASGNVGIGTAGSDAYKLSVNGNVRAKKVVVETGWSDYVFNNDYPLRNLYSLERYINQNKHLPDVPSAKEVEAQGVSIGENQALLLRKIEELTLYVIGLKKESDAQQKTINLLTQQLAKSPQRKTVKK